MPKHDIMGTSTSNSTSGGLGLIIDNILTFEVEDRFHVDSPDMEPLDTRSRIIPLLIHLLDLLDNQKANATFFILGWVARKFPEVVALIDSRGFEIASHGFTHGDVRTMPLDKFRSELERSKAVLEEIIGKPVDGYKAASAYLGREHLTHYRLIAQTGYKYDCSMVARGPRLDSQKPFPILAENDAKVMVIPQSTAKSLGVSLRYGENVRTFPGWLIVRIIRNLNAKGIPAMINMKLWELDTHHPRTASQGYFNYSEYGNLSLGEGKLRRLLERFRFSSSSNVLQLSQKPNLEGR